MSRRFRRAVVLATCAAAVALPALGSAAGVTASAASPGLSVAHVWNVFPHDSNSGGAVLAESSSRLAIALSGTSFANTWDRAQIISLDSGKSVSPFGTVPAFTPGTPYWVDEQRHLLFYATAAGTSPGSGSVLVGLRFAKAAPKPLFRVALRFGTRTAIGLAPDPAGRDLFVAASNDNSVNGSEVVNTAGSGVELDRVSIVDLLAGHLKSRWSSPYDAPMALCASLIASTRAAQMLALGSSLFLGCRQPQGPGSHLETVNATLPGVLALDHVDDAGHIATRFYSMPGNYVQGESLADRADGRLVFMDASYGYGARVFDAAHHRFVGRVPVGGQIPSGYAVDPVSGRLYVGTSDYAVGLATTDLRALVPTQGLRVPSPWGTFFTNNASALFTVDWRRHNLLVALQAGDPQHPVQLFVVHDGVPPYEQSAASNPDAGALDADETPGVSYSQRAASAEAFGADYQLIGGRANIQQNLSGDTGARSSPGSNFLRQAEVGQATLSNDESTANAVIGREDHVTDTDRSGVPNAGDTFAPATSCSDFGSSPQDKPVTAATAAVTCDVNADRTTASASFVGDNGVFVTTGHNAPVAAPVQVSRSSVSVTEQRQEHYGAVVTTITAGADGITLPGAVRIGSVTSTATVTTRGRPGTAVARRTVAVHDVVVAGTTLCSDDCSLAKVQSVLDTVQPGRFSVDFPAAQSDVSRAGTYAEVVQDPWYHAERVLDADKADTDYAVPGMAITVNFDGKTKSRLVVDLAAVAATSSYRVYPLSRATGSGAAHAPAPQAPPSASPPLGPLTGSSGPATPALAPVAAPATGVVPAIARAAHFVIGSLGRLVELLPVFALLGVPVYLSARRRLLLELPLLTRHEELK